MFRSTGTILLAGALLLQAPLLVPAAHAQQNGGWFVPKSSQPAEASAPARHRAAPQQRQAPQAVPAALPAQDEQQQPDPQAQGPQVQPVLPLPPIPSLTDLPKGSSPPPAVFGIISVPEVMHASSAAQQVEKVLGARRDKLNGDAQKEQAGWRESQQQIQAAAKGLTQEQVQTRVRALQARVQAAQKDFRNRNRIIQEAAQVAIGQIERELVQVIKQVSASHGMNFVLHREQVALNMPEFDITPQVVNQLNSTLPSVFIPADGVDAEVLARSGTYPTTANPGPQPVMAASAQAPQAAPPAAPKAAARK